MAQHQGKPIILVKYVSKGINATIFQNTNEKLQVYPTIVIERVYKDEDGKWQHTSSYKEENLQDVAIVSKKCYDFLNIKTFNQEYFDKKFAEKQSQQVDDLK